ncbi:DUF1684 domain-containing protein [Compostimonas suwonensis]|uniref:DUF1684 domain-containing protein n=1 Tax=Compostimonas suwonensis TaxID=1048394 RepID=A0A2M9C586_9MICO|nr:DUF1684 domain-containing protein [Compostimonas suwonensis]PJJ65672.1 hypothetical protein CLV54_0709 [Compostimonas suwonensis]
MSDTITALQVADWRRRVFGLYSGVRRMSASDPVAAHAAWVSARDDLFASHPATPLLPEDRDDFTGLSVAAYDPDWRFELEVVPGATPETFEFETGTDGLVPFELIGTVRVPLMGTLNVWRLASYGGGIFIPVKDALSRVRGGTYGGGRYLLDTVKGADLGSGASPDSLIVDFNFAYNPSCAYDPMWACPLAPASNTLAVEIPVGERYTGDGE